MNVLVTVRKCRARRHTRYISISVPIEKRRKTTVRGGLAGERRRKTQTHISSFVLLSSAFTGHQSPSHTPLPCVVSVKVFFLSLLLLRLVRSCQKTKTTTGNSYNFHQYLYTSKNFLLCFPGCGVHCTCTSTIIPVFLHQGANTENQNRTFACVVCLVAVLLSGV